MGTATGKLLGVPQKSAEDFLNETSGKHAQKTGVPLFVKTEDYQHSQEQLKKYKETGEKQEFKVKKERDEQATAEQKQVDLAEEEVKAQKRRASLQALQKEGATTGRRRFLIGAK